MTSYDYDLFVIGGGSGGVRAGRLAGSMGKRVGLAEEYRIGGTCVIRGCVPKKLFVYASQFSESFKDAQSFGWSIGEVSFDWAQFLANKDAEIARLETIYRKGLENAQVDIFESRALFIDEHTIEIVESGLKVTAEQVLIATGGHPNRQVDLPGGEFCITSNEVFHLAELPKAIVIAGGGYIAVEFANIFHGLGVETTLVYRGEGILSRFDGDVRRILHEEMEAKGIHILCGEVFEKVEPCADGQFSITLSDNKTLIADQVMLAIGRLPNTGNLRLDRTGVEIDSQGAIHVDEYSQTTVPNIWAVGDVTNRVQLTPVAIHEAIFFVETAFKNNPTKPDHQLVASAVFSQPEIATIGLSEEEAVKTYREIEIYRTHFRPMKNTFSGRNEKMLMKLVVDPKSRVVLGAHILGPNASEMIQILAITLKMGATKDDFDRTMAVHPTAAEELVTLYQKSYRIVNGVRID